MLVRTESHAKLPIPSAIRPLDARSLLIPAALLIPAILLPE